MPLSAVTLGGQLTVSSGSTRARRGRRWLLRTPNFMWLSVSVSTAAADTSEPGGSHEGRRGGRRPRRASWSHAGEPVKLLSPARGASQEPVAGAAGRCGSRRAPAARSEPPRPLARLDQLPQLVAQGPAPGVV